MNFWDKKEAKTLFQELAFYNTFIEKPHIKRVNNIDLLHKLYRYVKDIQEAITLK